MRNGPVGTAELSEAKNEIITEKLLSRETAHGRAFELADAAVRFGDPHYADALLVQIGAVTAADIQRVADRILKDEARVTVRYLNDADAERAGDEIRTSPSIAAAPLSVPPEEIQIVQLAPESERRAPPPAATPVPFQTPEADEFILDNGLRVVAARRPDLPIVSATLRIGAGASRDPVDQSGLADFAAELATKGTTSRSATENGPGNRSPWRLAGRKRRRR